MEITTYDEDHNDCLVFRVLVGTNLLDIRYWTVCDEAQPDAIKECRFLGGKPGMSELLPSNVEDAIIKAYRKNINHLPAVMLHELGHVRIMFGDAPINSDLNNEESEHDEQMQFGRM